MELQHLRAECDNLREEIRDLNYKLIKAHVFMYNISRKDSSVQSDIWLFLRTNPDGL